MKTTYFILLVFLQTYQMTTKSIEEVIVPSGDLDNNLPAPEFLERNSVCYDDLGCLSLNSSWYSSERPVNVMPMAREKIKTSFTLYTRQKPSQAIQVSAENVNGINTSSFKASRQTKFIIHGFLSSGYETHFKKMVSRLLENGDYNVIIVHWGKGAFTNYVQAAANTRLVGLEIAYLVNTLKDKLGVKVSDIHLIGHSLGAHTAGYAGEKIHRLGRITGLDPAGPLFRGMPVFVRLDPSDAQFVDVVHTDGATIGFGLSEPVGHLDFYPNGGQRQPGCGLSNFMSIKHISNASLSEIVACDHMRAIDLYSDSFLNRTECPSIGYECANVVSFDQGKCTSCGSDSSHCAPFGLQASNYASRTRKHVKLFFNTGATSPYNKCHYAVSIALANPSGVKNTVNGKLALTVSGNRGSVSNVQLIQSNTGAKLEHGKIQQFLIFIGVNLGTVKKINLRWEYQVNLLDSSTVCGLLCNKRLYIKRISMSSMNSFPETLSYRACSNSGTVVIDTTKGSDFIVGNSCG